MPDEAEIVEMHHLLDLVERVGPILSCAVHLDFPARRYVIAGLEFRSTADAVAYCRTSLLALMEPHPTIQ